MSETPPNGWTVETLRIHTQELREAQEKFEGERDRRYKELAEEREKSAHAKDLSDRDRLFLDREIQKYKDEKANELRAQINSERGLYATHAELNTVADRLAQVIDPLLRYYQSQQGARVITGPWLVAAVLFLLALLGGLVAVLNLAR